MNPDFNPDVPRVEEVPTVSHEEGTDIEDEMLRAAIEASRREAGETNRRPVDPSQDILEGAPVERFPEVRSTEDDDLARAVILSLKTAEEEKAMRDRLGASSEPVFMDEDDENPSPEDVRRLDVVRRRPFLGREELRRNDWMDEDEPPVDVLVRTSAPNITPWDQTDFSRTTGVPGRTSMPSVRGLAPQVDHPSGVRDVPIDWRNDGDGSSAPAYGSSGLRIEEVSSDVDTFPQPRHAQPLLDDELPSTAASFARTTGEQPGTWSYPTLPYPGPHIHPNYNPNAPRIADVPIISNEDGTDIEEEMLRAAIEASKREAEEMNRRSADPSQDALGGTPVERYPSVRSSEDDDLERAVTLSLKTAEEEKAMRERVGASSESVFMQEDEKNPSADDVRRLDSMRRRGTARDRTRMVRGGTSEAVTTSSGKGKARVLGESDAIISGAGDETEEVEEQPLLRRRTSRRSIPVTAEPMLLPDEGVAQSQTVRGVIHPTNSSLLPSAPAIGSGDEDPATGRSVPSQHDVDAFPSDEWGGISSQEHDEAVMLEAAIFGGLPEGSGLGLPYHARRGIRNEVMDDIAGGERAGLMASFNRRGFPQPPSPTVVAQRLLREQQDDEYLASLAADREKELKAIQEAEAQRVRDQEAAAAAESEEKLRREEELRLKEEAEELERQLNAKKGKLPMEPPVDAEGAVTLVVRLPDGSRRGRRFHKSDKLQNLFDFIDVGGAVKPGSYRLVRQFPRVAFTDGEHASSLESLGLTSKQEVLLLELI